MSKQSTTSTALLLLFCLVPWGIGFTTVPTRPVFPSATRTCSSSQLKAYQYALLFDCDGVILETEELHRRAYNAAFDEFGLTVNNGEPVHWSVEYYDMLQNTVGGGKPKMFYHFRNTLGGQFPVSTKHNPHQPPPATDAEQAALVDALQTAKTKIYKQMLERDSVPRPGVLRLMDQALADPRIAVGVCSASTKEAAQKTLALTLGPDRVQRLNVCILGDDVSAKKPNPLIYNVARERLNAASIAGNVLQPSDCIVIEDSLIGLQAAVGAGMKCVITYTSGTAAVDFYSHGAHAKVPDLSNVQLEDLFGPNGPCQHLVVGKKEPITSAGTSSAYSTSSTASYLESLKR